MTYAVFAGVLAKLGRLEEARAAVKDLLAHSPGLTYAKYREAPFWNARGHGSPGKYFAQGRAAGMTEKGQSATVGGGAITTA